MPYCARCGVNVHPFSFRSFSKTTQRCNKCDAQIQAAVIRFIDAFRGFAVDGVLTKAEWKQLEELAASENLDISEALHYASPDVSELIRKGVEIATKDHVITDHEEKYFDFLLQILSVPEALADEVQSTFNEYKAAQEIKKGKLPKVHSSLHLWPGEICHLESPATYINTDTKTYPKRYGKLWVTSMRLLFISPERHFDLEWKKVRTVVREDDVLALEMTIKKGNGIYIVEQPMIAEAIIRKLIELSSRASSQEPPNEQRKKKADESSRNGSRNRPASRSPYDILDVPLHADADCIRDAYRKMAKLYHPDKVTSLAPEFRELAELKMKEINAAYQQLTR